jgi:glutamate-1-semialdehyde 2,1-aminomutase
MQKKSPVLLRKEGLVDMNSVELFEDAKKYIPGGVNSPVRDFSSVSATPRFIERAKGSRIWDVEGREYIDYVGSWGPMILGHGQEEVNEAVKVAVDNGLSFGASTKLENEMAKLICQAVPSVEMVRMVNSGTEAAMSAIRVARGYTRKNKIIKFEGCYHGHSDALLVKAGSGVMIAGIPSSLGVPPSCTSDTLTTVFNDLESVRNLFKNNQGEIAAVIMELLPANMGVVIPEEGFLRGIKRLCEENEALLIADEVITGFRLGFGGAQEYFGIKPDLSIFGKIIGGGMPVGAYGGRKEIMSTVAPLGGVYQAGTLSGNPVAMTAGITQLSILMNNPEIYTHINKMSEMLKEGLRSLVKQYQLPATVNGIGSLSTLLFSDKTIKNYTDAKTCDTVLYAKYFKGMLDQGIYLAPSQFEATFVSYAHKKEDIEKTLDSADKVLKTI